jgi:hypothetical protein
MTGGAPHHRESLIRGPQSLLAKLPPVFVRMENTAFCQKTEIQSEKKSAKILEFFTYSASRHRVSFVPRGLGGSYLQ